MGGQPVEVLARLLGQVQPPEPARGLVLGVRAPQRRVLRGEALDQPVGPRGLALPVGRGTQRLVDLDGEGAVASHLRHQPVS